MSQITSETRRVLIAAPPHAQSLDISGPLAVFREANGVLDAERRYACGVLSMTADRLIDAGGLTIRADFTIDDVAWPLDTLLIAGTPRFREALSEAPFLAWLRAHAADARRYGSVCTGAFMLGAAGLLDGRRVTTHWAHAAELAERCPNATVSDDAIYIQDGALYTSAGVTAGIDLALKLVEDDHGRDLALHVARRLVVFLRRPGGQSQFSAHLAAQIAEEGPVQALQRWILDNVAADLSRGALAARCGMSVRTFTRRFAKEAGRTPADFVELARVDAARRLLEDTDTPLQRVAARCGFSSADVMRQAFKRRLGRSPGAYRETFRGGAV